MPTLPKALVSSVQLAISAFLLSTASHVAAQTAPAAPATAATASQPGLSESILRQAQGPYRMIMNSPTVVRPKAAVAPAVAPVPAAARVPEPVTAPAPPLRRSGSTAPEVQAPQARQVPVTARAAPAPETVAAPVNVPPQGPTLSPVIPAQAATPAVNPVAVPVAMPVTVPTAAPQRAAQPAVAVVVERPLVAVRQEEPLLSGPLARERPTGVVQVGFNVNADGSTGDVSVVSSTNRKLNSAVINAVTKWVYQPLEAVRRVEVAIEFKND